MERDTWLKIKFFTAVLCVMWLAFICVSAGAATLRGNKESCTQLGNVVLQASDMRDSGVPWEVFQDKLAQIISEARKNPDSFVHTDEEAGFITKSLRLLWQSPDDPPWVVATAVYRACMETK